MRKLRLVVVALAVAAVVPLPSHAGDANQHVTGTAYAPTRFAAGDVTTQAYPGVQRRVDIVTMGLANGAAGYVFPIDQSTWCDGFTLTLNSSSATTPDDPNADIDIYFYTGWDDVIGSDAVNAYGYEKRQAGGEIGYVPPDTIKAMVFSYNTVNASFTYDATANDLAADQCDDQLPPMQ